MPNNAFNPLSKENIAVSIERALTSTTLYNFEDVEPFYGAGIYALYYFGSFSAYKPLSEANRHQPVCPIYVGKADVSGKRKGGFLDDSTTSALFKRLQDHSKSLAQVSNINISDFKCRFLVMDETWVSLGESMLISKYNPVWNACVDGFGNHNPGKGRKAGARSKWDTLHPGRPWADPLSNNSCSIADILDEVSSHFSTHPPYENLNRYEYAFFES